MSVIHSETHFRNQGRLAEWRRKWDASPRAMWPLRCGIIFERCRFCGAMRQRYALSGHTIYKPHTCAERGQEK